ncbi:hypothetical protein QQ054_20270 [Oscillatoria amoena NRMC-F 0135]|nr:hypothetical protein [Oscillatoria amoena NRMC-F 0135]
MIKKHYRKNTQAKQELEELIDNYLLQLEVNPCSSTVSDDEGFPKGTAESDFEFRKKRWRRLPGLQGAARYGRLLFVVCHPKKIVYLVWIYTHAEFELRPPDKELKEQINFAKQESLTEVVYEAD